MQSSIKAVVFRTAQLKSTHEFFEKVLHFKIKESSARHFVIYNKGLRLVFIESNGEFEIEMYVSKREEPEIIKDPNGITIINT